MKKSYFLLLLFAVISTRLFAQKLSDSLSKLNNQQFSHNYAVKAKHQKTGGLVLLFGGLETALAGIGIAPDNFHNSPMTLWSSDPQPSEKGGEAGTVLAAIGFTAFVASLPLLFALMRNHHKAKLYFRQIKQPLLQLCKFMKLLLV